MLSLQFLLQNAHFALNLLVALVAFAAFWLYFDAWTVKKERRELFRWAGFLLLAVAYLMHATLVEQPSLASAGWANQLEPVSEILKLIAFASIAFGLVIEPLPIRPGRSHKGKTPVNAPAYMAFLPILIVPFWFVNAGAVAGALLVGGLYLRRVTAGLERHLRPVALAFLLLGLSEVLALREKFANTDNPNLEGLVAPFGWLWALEHLLVFIGVILFGRWVWQYLVRRIQTQLFMVFTVAITIIFLITTVTFTFLLFDNVRGQVLKSLNTTSGILKYAAESRTSETLAQAQLISQQPEVVAAIAAKDHTKLLVLTNGFLTEKRQSSLIITTSAAEVLLRAEDPGRFGDSLSSDGFIRRAAAGMSTSGNVSKDEGVFPVIYSRSAVPVRDASNKITGVVIVGVALDDSFLQGIKSATGLESAVYAENLRVATTHLGSGAGSSTVGLRDSSPRVQQQVLKDGKAFLGEVKIGGLDYLASYQSLKDDGSTVVGMLFVGQPTVSILQTASRSIERTFVVALALLVTSLVPAYLVTRNIARQFP